MGNITQEDILILQGCIKLIESESKDFYNVKQISYNKCFCFKLYVHQRILKKGIAVSTKYKLCNHTHITLYK